MVGLLSLVLQCTSGLVLDLVLHDCSLRLFTFFAAFLILISAIYLVNKDYY